MRRIIWASMLLGLAVVLMPLLFITGETAPLTAENYEPPVPVRPATPTPPPQSYKTSADSEIKITVLSGGELIETGMAEYLPKALAAEMPASFHEEALKAQAVAARTYIVYCTEHQNPKHPEADICAEAGCCLACLEDTELRATWGGDYDKNLATIKAAAADTDGQLLTYSGEPILASFHSSSAGYTENGAELWGEVPYLICVESPETERDVPDFITTVEVSVGDMRDTVKLLKPNAVFSEDASSWLGETELDESGRVSFTFIGGEKLTGSEMRSLFSLRSTAFKLEYSEGRFLFTVTGYGHGLGMSQYGANVMAKNGFNYKEILYHYYPQTKLI